VNDLPLNGRNFTQLLSLTPGVAPISVGQNSMGGRVAVSLPHCRGRSFLVPLNQWRDQPQQLLSDRRHE